MIKLIELNKETVTIEMGKDDLIKLRLMLTKGKRLLNMRGDSLSESETAILWNITAIKNIATRGMVSQEDSIAWVKDVAERVSEEAKVKDDRAEGPYVNSECARRLMEKSDASDSADACDSETAPPKEGAWFDPNTSKYGVDRAT